MKLTNVEPEDLQYYWWLPYCDRQHYANPNRWTVVFCSPTSNIGRVGLWKGPITMAIPSAKEVDNL